MDQQLSVSGVPTANMIQITELQYYFEDMVSCLHSFSEFWHRNVHRAIFINFAEEIPQPKLAMIKIILQSNTQQSALLETEHRTQHLLWSKIDFYIYIIFDSYGSRPYRQSKHASCTWMTFMGSRLFGGFLAINPPTPP